MEKKLLATLGFWVFGNHKAVFFVVVFEDSFMIPT